MSDICDECTAYGDDYYINEDGEDESYCTICPFNQEADEEDE